MIDLFHKHVLDQIGSSEIFHTKFFSENFTHSLYELFKEHKEWTTKRFAYSTHDVHLEESFPDLFDLIKERFDNSILKVMADVWALDQAVETKDIFIVKYSKDTQTKLKTHVDDSYISGSIKLNNNYKGGILTFPRQSVTNQETEVGDLLIWPSQITHPHNSTLLEEGEKYSITIWTACKNNS
tara:strand:+ start:216 stop:764 length:549 start_codon:yes stop_codon:yes gene_type:complete